MIKYDEFRSAPSIHFHLTILAYMISIFFMRITERKVTKEKKL